MLFWHCAASFFFKKKRYNALTSMTLVPYTLENELRTTIIKRITSELNQQVPLAVRGPVWQKLWHPVQINSDRSEFQLRAALAGRPGHERRRSPDRSNA
jgi:hypothetical protein